MQKSQQLISDLFDLFVTTISLVCGVCEMWKCEWTCIAHVFLCVCHIEGWGEKKVRSTGGPESCRTQRQIRQEFTCTDSCRPRQVNVESRKSLAIPRLRLRKKPRVWTEASFHPLHFCCTSSPWLVFFRNTNHQFINLWQYSARSDVWEDFPLDVVLVEMDFTENLFIIVQDPTARYTLGTQTGENCVLTTSTLRQTSQFTTTNSGRSRS